MKIHFDRLVNPHFNLANDSYIKGWLLETGANLYVLDWKYNDFYHFYDFNLILSKYLWHRLNDTELQTALSMEESKVQMWLDRNSYEYKVSRTYEWDKVGPDSDRPYLVPRQIPGVRLWIYPK